MILCHGGKSRSCAILSFNSSKADFILKGYWVCSRLLESVLMGVLEW